MFKSNKIVTKDFLLNRLTEEMIFSYYIQDFVTDKPINSPLRKDSIPSFSITNKHGTYFYKDFATGDSGDCIKFVAELYSISYINAISKIAYDFGLQNANTISSVPIKKNHIIKTKSREVVNLQVKFKEWDTLELSYWNKYGITKDTLLKYRVYPISYVFFNNYPIKVTFAFAYIENKDNKVTYKIYQPLAPKEEKWFNNNNYSVWEGWEQLPEKVNILIWTKSRKDVMSIVSTTEYSAIACQAESVIPKDHIVNQLKNKANKIVLFYDNDYDKSENWGLNHVKKLSEKFNLPYIIIPDEFEVKDYSDFVVKYGAKEAQKLLKFLISKYI
tara:strand:- start:6633 stop:7622 length:990 start_codon:yes stop_codon:yes gene_type:complete